MAYIINDSRGQVVAIIPDGTIDDTSTSLQLVGRGVTEYGVPENENYVFIMENFAKDSAPVSPLQGQLWFNTANNTMMLRSNISTWQSLASTQYVEAQKISPVFTGIPQAPTAIANTYSTQIATTAYVQNNKVDPNFTGIPTAPTASTLTNTIQIATTEFVQNNKVSPIFTGVPTAPTAPRGTNTTQIATTAFVTDGPLFIGVPEAPTAPAGTANAQIATTEFITNSVQLAGAPTAPTAAVGTANTQIATTAFVSNSPVLTGVPTAPTAPAGTANNQIATTAFITNSVQLAGNPTAPTVSGTDNSATIATTSFVQQQKIAPVLVDGDTLSDPNKVPRSTTAIYPGTVLNQIATVGYVTQAVSSLDLAPYATKASPIFTGIPQAPTAATSTSSTQLATTAFVKNVAASEYGLWQGSAKYVSTGDPSPSTGNDGDFWFKYQP
jgi:hypothetical protein